MQSPPPFSASHRQLVHHAVQVLVAEPERLEEVLLPDLGQRDHRSHEQQPLHWWGRRRLLQPQLRRPDGHAASQRDAQPENAGAGWQQGGEVGVDREEVDGEVVELVEVAAGTGKDRVRVSEGLLVVREHADARALQHVDNRVLVHAVGTALVRRAEELVAAAGGEEGEGVI